MLQTKRIQIAGWLVVVLAMISRPLHAAPSEIKVDHDFLGSILAKLPRVPFAKDGQYRGFVDAFRLSGIEPRTRQIIVSCNVQGEFDETAIVAALKKTDAARSPGGGSPPTAVWRKFRFDVRVAINIEPGGDGAPRLRFKVQDIKRKELEGIIGPLAKLMGRAFDQIVTTYADKKAAGVNDQLNAEVVKRVSLFKDYGMLCGVDYFPTHVVMLFDLTRLRSEGIAGYVFTSKEPGTIPLYRWVNPKRGDHFYTTSTTEPDARIYRNEGIACYVLPEAEAKTVPLLRYRGKNECFYTSSKDVAGLKKVGYRLEGVACYVFGTPALNTVPLYRFVDPSRGLHFYSIHPQAEFAK